MSRPTCVSKACSFLIHTDGINNNGMHCCLMCMKFAGRHGPLCKKEVVVSDVVAPAAPAPPAPAAPAVVAPAVPVVVVSEVVAEVPEVPAVVVSEVVAEVPEVPAVEVASETSV